MTDTFITGSLKHSTNKQASAYALEHEETVQIEITKDTTVTLAGLLRRVEGDPKGSYRGHTDDILEVLYAIRTPHKSNRFIGEIDATPLTDKPRELTVGEIGALLGYTVKVVT